MSLRVAVIGTPRSGNTWVRSTLAKAMDLQQLAVHNPKDIPSVLPDRLVLQIHWYREPAFQLFLRSHAFRIVVLSRHPLDVLLSVVRFVKYEPLTARWLEGNAEIPPGIHHHPPASPAFRAYATSWGAENLLSISYQWWNELAAIKVRYEHLVEQPVREFSNLLEKLHQPVDGVPAAVSANPLEVLRNTPNRHGWQGTPGLWRQTVLPADAWHIFRRHRRVFQFLNYRVPPYLLTRRSALRNWERLTLA